MWGVTAGACGDGGEGGRRVWVGLHVGWVREEGGGGCMWGECMSRVCGG